MPFKSKAQQRFMFAAEARGDVPKGTARRWAHETPSIKGLPERKKMKKTAMFFEDRDAVDDGMFMKRATEIGKIIESSAPKSILKEVSRKAEKLPVKVPPPEEQIITSEEAKPQPTPLFSTPPAPVSTLLPPKRMKYAMLGVPKTAQIGTMGIKQTPPVGGNINVGPAGAGVPMPMGMPGLMGIPSMSFRKQATEKAPSWEILKERGISALGGVGPAVRRTVGEGLTEVEKLPDWAKAALAGGVGLYGYGKLKKGVKRAVRKPPPKASAWQRLLAGARRLRGK